ncbi:hypothetical protein [Paraburkholderia lacunae]|uniref:Uncharacterized protein n=1 Tax=Paraburkholderia lacunae TaxID=2211104 RepID=A0A370MZA4_9BURK|nr:hypothetical protein [Paraburkholderia lacunae]RDJ98527.1 hypothetical protein DLM46_32890 [Paraburkholderia lacunae]
MGVDEATTGLWALFRETPFPRIQLLAGGSSDERLHALDSVDCDVLVVAGGLGDIEAGIERLSKIGKPVIYVPGVEEYCGRDVLDVAKVGSEAARDTTVHVLDRRSLVLAGVRFLGATFWTSPEVSGVGIHDWPSKTRDEFREIRSAKWWADASNAEYASALCLANGWTRPDEEVRTGDHGLHPVVSLVENRRALAWLSSELATDFAGPTVVVTHFEPMPNGRQRIPRAEDMSQVRSMLRGHRYAADLWLYGHARTTRETVVDGVRVFGGFATTEATMDFDELFNVRRLERSATKGRRGAKAAPTRVPISSPILSIERGLISPLKLIVEPLIAEMQRVAKDIDAIVPHTMARSTTLRMCVCRTIHSEVELFKQAAEVAYDLERELYPPENNIESVIMAARKEYDAPLGYPSKEPKEIRFDYYGLVAKMARHIEWLSELPNRAVWALGRWTQRTYNILRYLERHGIEACVVPPPVQALRFERLSNVIDVRLKVSVGDFDIECSKLRKSFPRDTEWPFIVRLTPVDGFPEDQKRLLTLSRLREIAGGANFSTIIA